MSIPIPYLSWFDAKRTCDKFVECNYYNYDYPLLPRFLANSMLGPLEDYDDWLDFYTLQKDSPAMLRECETGGRYLHWIGYRWIEVHNVLVLEITNNLLTFCFEWWMIGVKLHLCQCPTFTTSIQPNNWTLKHGDRGNQTQRIQINVWSPTWDWSPMLLGVYCTSWSTNPVYTLIFRYDFACEQTDWQWAMCTACFLPVTFTTENSYVIARGLCSRTKFDTQFEVTFYISLVQRHVHVDFNM